MLLAYAAILYVYMGQMLVLWRLPSNMIGWPVLVFLVAGACNLMLLAGQNGPAHVRFFRRFWFWLTLPPLALLIYAAFLRVDHYGLTPNRIVLMGGAIWALLLAGLFISGRRQLRFIPLFGVIVLTILAVGPLNLNLTAARDQAARISAVFEAAGVDGFDKGKLTQRETRVAMAAMESLYLMPDARPMLEEVLAAFNITLDAEQYPLEILRSLGYQGTQQALEAAEDSVTETQLHEWLDEFPALDVAETPIFLGEFELPPGTVRDIGDIALGTFSHGMVVTSAGGSYTNGRPMHMQDFLRAETGYGLSGTPFDFSHDGRKYRALPKLVSAKRIEEGGQIEFRVERLSIYLFASPPLQNVPETAGTENLGDPSESSP